METVDIEIDSTVYKLSKEITGRQYLELRRKSIKVPPINGSGEQPQAEFDHLEFSHWNLVYRLKEPELTSEEILELSRSVYQSLILLAGRIDNEEAGSISDFLRKNSHLFPTLQSTLEQFSDSLPATTEALSESE